MLSLSVRFWQRIFRRTVRAQRACARARLWRAHARHNAGVARARARARAGLPRALATARARVRDIAARAQRAPLAAAYARCARCACAGFRHSWRSLSCAWRARETAHIARAWRRCTRAHDCIKTMAAKQRRITQRRDNVHYRACCS